MDSFLESLSGKGGDHIIGLVAVVGGILLPAVIVGFSQWKGVRQAEAAAATRQRELELKLQMVEKGMSPADIERVLAAGPAAPGSVRA